jgi:sensor c-di-GMP phosphodiesterase-like protein
VRLIDVALVTWVIAWIGLGVAIGIEMHRLADLSNTVSVDGRAIDSVGTSLTSLSDLPVVGNVAARAGRQAQQAGQSAITSGQSSKVAIGMLSVLLAIAVALLPSVPMLAVYVPWRLNRQRGAQALQTAVREELSRLGVSDARLGVSDAPMRGGER